jgi:hypothetical protein
MSWVPEKSALYCKTLCRFVYGKPAQTSPGFLWVKYLIPVYGSKRPGDAPQKNKVCGVLGD